MALANVALTELYITVHARINQMITLFNKLTDGNAATAGTLTMDNPYLFNGGVTLNVANGMIAGDGGLISNVRGSVVSSIPNSSLQNTNVLVSSSSDSLTVTNGAFSLGSSSNIDLSITTSSDETDTSTTNLASAKAVSNVNARVTSSYNQANTARDLANTASSNTVTNATNITTNQTNITSNAAVLTGAVANIVTNAAQVVFARAHANGAYGQANTARTLGNTASSNTVTNAAQIVFARAHANSGYGQANTARNLANTANSVAYSARVFAKGTIAGGTSTVTNEINSTVVRNSAGVYSVIFDTPPANANYQIMVSGVSATFYVVTPSTANTTMFTFKTFFTSTGATADLSQYYYVVYF